MDKEEKIQSILKAVESEIRQWVEEESSIKDPILYERKLLESSFRSVSYTHLAKKIFIVRFMLK